MGNTLQQKRWVDFIENDSLAGRAVNIHEVEVDWTSVSGHGGVSLGHAVSDGIRGVF